MNTKDNILNDSAEQGKLVDFTYLNEFAEGDAAFIQTMVDLFMQNLPVALEIILNSNEADDIKILKAEIHKLKSSISLLGIVPASKSIEIIENEIETNPFGQKRKDEVEKFNEICLQVFTELEILFGYSEK